MAYARFFRLIAVLALLIVLGISTAWLLEDWFPTGNDEITHLQNAHNVASELAEAPLRGLRDAWMGRYQGEERYAYWPGAAYIATAPLCWLGGTQAPLLALIPVLLLLLWAVGTGAHDLATRLPQATQIGSVAEVERRMGVGRKASRMLQDTHQAAAWRAVLLALLPTVTLLELRHYTLAPFVAAMGAVSVTLLVLSQGFRHRGLSMAWGLCLGLGLMADRTSMAFLVWAPLLVALLQPGQRKQRLFNQALGLGIALLMAGPFYLHWWQAWGGRIASQEASAPMAMVERLGQLALWIPLQGLGLVAALLLGLGLLGYLVRRPGWRAGFITWVAALLSPLPLLALTEEGQGGLVLFLVAPLAVLAGVGWGRSRVHTSAAGTSLLALGTLLAMGAHAVSSGLLPLEPSRLTPLADRQGEPRAEADRAAVLWLDAESSAVLDLVQAKGIWAGHWLHYLLSTEHPELSVDEPVRRLHAAYLPGRFVEAPCEAQRLLVVHLADPWFDAEEIARPTGFVGMDEAQRTTWQQAVSLARRCYRVDRAVMAPMGPRLTFLERRDDVAELIAAQARRADEALSAPADTSTLTQGPLPPSEVDPIPEGARCPEGMVLVPGGRYALGPGPETDPVAPWHTPDRVAALQPYCMDVFEYPNQQGAPPRSNVTWEEARLLCGAQAKRLCSVDEWEVACRGPERWRYSYGPDYEPTRCYTEGAPTFDVKAVKPSGSFPDCVSPAGIHDLNGSLSEWVDASRPGPPFPPDPTAGDKVNHEIMGGTMWGASYGQDCMSRHWHAEGHRQDDDGFRCCADAVTE
jgi:hypothetical protein